ncbi:Phosphoribosylglycinamide formyltransferase, chloroplastic [Apostasia shenzhenica]|uniref:Phosphoribosylglycinamide formyltransferase, chloroplastic n=1 Tax=Apostasia shenzhenica TaxID=1088818 RepID=A0A2H9ZZL4_9ASPA|nr:Phosphoribosylglycinamide formyltransferase, chloroplastic [Apostasia shenzhenica]
MEVASLNLGARAYDKVINFPQSHSFSRLVAARQQKVGFGKVYYHGSTIFCRRSWILKALRCKCNFYEDVNSTEGEFNSVNIVRRKKLAVFVSGGGSNFRSIHDSSVNGLIHGDVVVLVTDKPGCGGDEYARNHDIPVLLFPKLKSSVEGLSPTELVITLRKFKVDFILLAGYLKLIPMDLVQAYPRSILNIHPSLLPAFGGKGFYGLKVHEAVIASGARYSGPTVHFVDEHFDTGKILAQKTVPVYTNDTPEQLACRVLHQEHQVYVEVVSALCEERIVWREDGVPLIRSRENPNEYT